MSSSDGFLRYQSPSQILSSFLLNLFHEYWSLAVFKESFGFVFWCARSLSVMEPGSFKHLFNQPRLPIAHLVATANY